MAGWPRSHSLNTQAQEKLKFHLPLPHRGSGDGAGLDLSPGCHSAGLGVGMGLHTSLGPAVWPLASPDHTTGCRPAAGGPWRWGGPVHRGRVWPPEHALLHSKWWVWIIHFLDFSRPLLDPSTHLPPPPPHTHLKSFLWSGGAAISLFSPGHMPGACLLPS